MSGGSWDYVYGRVGEAAERLQRERSSVRRAFGRHLALVAHALHEIEWCDSGDHGGDQDVVAMRACLTPHQEADELRAMIAALRADLVELEARLP